MKKLAVILHGWPQTEMNQHFLKKFLEHQGYCVVIPDLYKLDFKGSEVANVLTKKIKSHSSNNSPDLIVGISMGGLILPSLAEEFPRAKLIFIATSPKFIPEFNLMKTFAFLVRYKYFRALFLIICKLISDRGIEKVYRVLNPFDGDPKFKNEYEKDLAENLKAINRQSPSKHIEIISFIASIDNTELLKRIDNEALIFSSKADKLMPLREGKKLKNLIKSSRLIISNGMHFNVFVEKNLAAVKDFLRK